MYIVQPSSCSCRGHTEDIECLAVHPQEALCATGQGGAGEDSAHVQVRQGATETRFEVKSNNSFCLALILQITHASLNYGFYVFVVAAIDSCSVNQKKLQQQP